jgi:hypothetical protein
MSILFSFYAHAPNIIRFFILCTRHQIKKKTEMGGACGTCAGEEMCIQGFGGET